MVKMILLIAAVALLILAGRLTAFFVGFSREVDYLKAEIRRADSHGERRHWERELKMLYWSLVPGISQRSAYKIVHRKRKQK